MRRYRWLRAGGGRPVRCAPSLPLQAETDAARRTGRRIGGQQGLPGLCFIYFSKSLVTLEIDSLGEVCKLPKCILCPVNMIIEDTQRTGQ